MNKLIAITLLIILVTGLVFTSGCLDEDTTPGSTTITSNADASSAVSDLGSDVSGITETLNGIDDDLG